MENHKEDILKKFLQDTFSDYEPEPSDASWENIFSAIQPNQPTFWGKSKPWIASVLVIITGVWLWYGSTNVEATHGEIAFNAHEPAGALVNGQVGTLATDENLLVKTPTKAESERVGTLATDENLLVKTPTKARLATDENLLVKTPTKAKAGLATDENLLVKTSTKARLATDENLLVKTPTKAASGRVETLATDEKNESSITKYSKEIIVKNNTPKEGGENHPTVEKQSDEVVVSKDNFTASTSGRVETLTTDESVTKNSIIEQVRYIRPVESLRNKDFTLTKITLNSPMITPIITPNREAKPVRQHTYLSMNITPIQTYRILTINNHNVQNVQVNNLFDSERNGWQFDLGIIKPIGKLWNFRANLSYLRMRQWSEYQIGTDELILRNNSGSSSNSNPSQGTSSELEVVGQSVIESKNLHMVGLKIDVQKFFKITAKNRYFISTGTQMMYENSQRQSNIFLNVSAGFQHIVSKTTFLTIEPTASYSLNNFNDSKSLLQANGYNLGLKMGVSFKVK
jgi:hypothetical protein